MEADWKIEAERLATLEDYRLLDTPREPVFDAIVRQAAAGADAPIAMITLIDDRRQWFKAALGVDHREDPIDQSICAHAIRGDALFEVPDASVDARFAHFPTVAREGGIRFYAGVPLTMKNGARLGTLCVIDTERRDGLDAEERALLERLARRTVAAFELARDMHRDETLPADPATANERVWLDQALSLMARASAALDRVEASAALAHLEQAIVTVEARRATL